MSERVGVVVFPGSNCEFDVVEAVGSVGGDGNLVWHGDTSLAGFDAVVLPGGFAHGDYLRPGAIARFSPIMDAVRDFAAAGGPVVGICNGFQILTEAGLLPGALQKNAGNKFICHPVQLRVESINSALTNAAELGAILRIPVNHGEGNFTCDAATLREIEAKGQVVFRYVENPNGSMSDIAGVANEAGNVVGLMPHPERASEELLGSADGRVLLESLLGAATTPLARSRPA
ncbi:MAG: phosphoribosylformylglycinamidine synthase subunit PurQ [Actinobacteria bacterium]|nr:phosphoribosylformylglycinamidine synthase subunit PurQ [Actinomycetota bacterium]